MAGTPEMQEQFPARAPTSRIPKNEVLTFSTALDGRYAGNAGAFFGGCVNIRNPE
jgi:hypothetical protein